ncbi:uncharacterized protein [Aegilops tauschii subsp. strangulata]|uniref:uncharacterized protein isoform X2 n=1 Tax=Aegilops tauschii subsp. strangulata TaxID=200361 RepID=UPI001ABC5E8D
MARPALAGSVTGVAQVQWEDEDEEDEAGDYEEVLWWRQDARIWIRAPPCSCRRVPRSARWPTSSTPHLRVPRPTSSTGIGRGRRRVQAPQQEKQWWRRIW